ncbi:MAG: hypothetical protein M9958_07995 [Chitinophagales bacterium]|nr:hypothetical protein [Chitinophagales bacterium]
MRLKDISISILSATIFLWAKGFIFNSADQVEPLVLVYKKLNPSLFQGDFYVESAKDIFTVRFYYIQLLAFLGKYFSLYNISLVLTFCCLFFSALGLVKIVRKLTDGRLEGYFAPFFVLFLFLEWTVGGNVLQYNLLIGSALAKALSIWAIYLLLQRRYFFSGFLVGLAGLFQVLVGLQIALIVITFMLFIRNWNGVFRWGTTWLFCISPMLLPILYRQFSLPVTDVDEKLFYTILYRFRNPEHYLPSLFSINSYIKISILMFVGNLALFIFLDRKLFYRFQLVNGIIVLGLIVYSMSIENFSLMSIGKIQWFKTTIGLNVIASLGLAIGLESVLRYFKQLNYPCLLGSLSIIFWALFLHFPSLADCLDKRTEDQKELSEVHKWVNIHTPIDALFVTYIDDESFMCEAKRSLTLSWNCMIHEPWFLLKWYKNFYQQYHVNTLIYNHIEVKRLANKYYESGAWLGDTKAQYCIVRKGVLFPNTQELFSTTHYEVLKIN